MVAARARVFGLHNLELGGGRCSWRVRAHGGDLLETQWTLAPTVTARRVALVAAPGATW
jgi:hypothetical protein